MLPGLILEAVHTLCVLVRQLGEVKEFGVYKDDLKAVSKCLLGNDVKTVAMESTGTYWQALFAVLQANGLQVILCNGKFTKNSKGRKTDVQDCQFLPVRSGGDSKVAQHCFAHRNFFTR